MKVKPVTIITKHIRPISLTPDLFKLAEEIVVSKYIGSAVLELIRPNQFSAVPKSSTLHALISVVHTWAQATDGTGSAVRVVLLDYRKAFDLNLWITILWQPRFLGCAFRAGLLVGSVTSLWTGTQNLPNSQ